MYAVVCIVRVREGGILSMQSESVFCTNAKANVLMIFLHIYLIIVIRVIITCCTNNCICCRHRHLVPDIPFAPTFL